MSGTKKQVTRKIIWCFAIGQLGWSILSALVTNWLMKFYQPDVDAIRAGQPIFIPQGRAVLGIIAILGAVMALGRIFDAVTDPLIASKSDRSKSPHGRRIPFMRMAAIPFALSCMLVFWSPVSGTKIDLPAGKITDEMLEGALSGTGSWANAGFLVVMLLLFYLFMTMYCTPYNALIPELGTDQKTRMAISTAISFTFIAGTAVAYMAPNLWSVMEGFVGNHVAAGRLTYCLLAAVGLVCMFVPVLTIREKDYVHSTPSDVPAMKSLAATFRNRDFRAFVASDVAYFLGLAMFQTALPFFVTSLLHLDEGWSGTFFVLMTALSLIFYIPVSKLTPRLGKKKLILIAFCIFTVAFLFTATFNGPDRSAQALPAAAQAQETPAEEGIAALSSDAESAEQETQEEAASADSGALLQGLLLCLIAAPAMAIFGILPQAVVADIAEADEMETSENRSGMFYAARTFSMKMGQSIGVLLVSSLATIGLASGTGYRIVAVVAAIVCMGGGLLFLKYDEKKIYGKILHHAPEKE